MIWQVKILAKLDSPWAAWVWNGMSSCSRHTFVMLFVCGLREENYTTHATNARSSQWHICWKCSSRSHELLSASCYHSSSRPYFGTLYVTHKLTTYQKAIYININITIRINSERSQCIVCPSLLGLTEKATIQWILGCVVFCLCFFFSIFRYLSMSKLMFHGHDKT